MAFGAYLLNVIICLLVVKPYFAWQAGGNEAIARHGIAYIRICMLFSFGQMIQWVFDRLLIATGKSTLFLATLGTASIVNVILDPILIFGYFGFPAMGTAGAAIATVTGQLAGGLLGIYLNIRKNGEIPIHFTLHISKKPVWNILKVGIPTAIMQGIMSVMGIFINTILYQFSSTAVAIYGILLRVQNLAQIGVQGINNGLIPIIAYNYGAKKEKRIHETIRCAFIYAFAMMAVILIILEIIPDKILMLFDASEQMLQMGVPAVRIISVSFFISSAGIIFAAIFQGFSNGTYSMYLAFMRQVILLIPILLTGAFMGSLTVIWFGFIIAEALAIPFGIWLYRKIMSNAFAYKTGGISVKKLKLAGLLLLLAFGIAAPIMTSAGEWRHAAEDMIPINIQIGNRMFSASLQNSESALALSARFPMTITMNEMNGNEKYFYLPSSLPTASARVDTVRAGDLMLYGSDCLVLFYEDLHTTYQYTRLGSISDSTGLLEALGSGNAQVTFSLASQ